MSPAGEVPFVKVVELLAGDDLAEGASRLQAGLGERRAQESIFVGGEIAGLGNDALEEPLTAEDDAFLRATLAEAGLEPGRSFRKIVSGEELYNFDKREVARWGQAL